MWNPYDYPDLLKVNSQACEQKFSWSNSFTNVKVKIYIILWISIYVSYFLDGIHISIIHIYRIFPNSEGPYMILPDIRYPKMSDFAGYPILLNIIILWISIYVSYFLDGIHISAFSQFNYFRQ